MPIRHFGGYRDAGPSCLELHLAGSASPASALCQKSKRLLQCDLQRECVMCKRLEVHKQPCEELQHTA